jgi:hypothetical protein
MHKKIINKDEEEEEEEARSKKEEFNMVGQNCLRPQTETMMFLLH